MKLQSPSVIRLNKPANCGPAKRRPSTSAWALWLVLAILGTATSSSYANLISAKYRHSNEGDATFSGAAVLGAPGDQWNDIDDNGFNGQAHTFSPIIDTTGATVAGVSFQTLNNYWGGNYWGNGGYNANNFNVNSGSTPFYDLLRTYFGDLDQQITGLTPGGFYDLVIYLHTHDNRALAIWCNGTVKYGAYDLSGPPLVNKRDYMVFSNIAADGSGNIRWYRQDWNEGRWSGFQLRPHVSGTVTGSNGSATIAKNAFKVFAPGNFGFSSTDALGSLELVKVTSLPTAGQLLLSGNPVLVNQIVSFSSINSGNLIYYPNTGATGADTFQFRVSDGANYSASTNTFTINVVPQFNQLDIQFYRVASGDTAFGPGAAVIGSGGDQWNNLDMGDNNGAPHFTTITDVAGAPTGVTVDFANYPGVDDWGNGDYNTWGQYDVVPQFNVNSGSTSFYNLLRSYVGDPDVTINGLTPGNYDIFAIVRQQDGRQQGVTLNGVSKPYGQNTSTQAGAPMILNRDYVLFKNFPVASDGKLRITRWQYDRLLLSGLQIRPSSGNTAPTAADKSFTLAKNSFSTLKLADFGFADADTGDELQSVKAVSLPGPGQLKLSGIPVLLNQIISQADIKNGNLTYYPAPGGTGSPYDSFQFKVSDGVALSAAANTLTFNVVPQASLIDIQFYRINSGDTAFGPGAAVIGAAGNQWNNLDMGDNNGQYAPHFTTITDVAGAPTGVTVDFANYPGVDDWGNGDYNTWGQYDVVPQFNVNSGSTSFYNLLRSYVGDPDVTINGLTPGNYDIFAIVRQQENRQQGVTMNGVSKPYGQNTSTQAGAPLILNRDYVLFKNFPVASDGKLRITRWAYDRLLLSGLQIRPATGNTAPTAGDGTFAMSLNTARVLQIADFAFSDADVGDELQAVKITAIPTAGKLYLSGIEVLLNQVISVADIKNGNLQFVPTPYASGIGYSTLQFMVSDGVAFSAAKTATFDVLPRPSLVDVKFLRSANGDNTFGPGAAVVGSPTDQWNNLEMGVNNGQYAPHFTSILDVGGAATGLSVDFANYPGVDDWGNTSYNTYDGFNVNSGSSPVYYDLLRSYVGDPDVTINGLTPGLYDFIALVRQQDGRQQGVTLNGVSKSYGQSSGAGTGAPLVNNRDYVIFSAVPVGSDGKLRITRWQYDRLLLSGFQIQQTPTPAGGVTGNVSVVAGPAHPLTLSELAFASIDYGNTSAQIKITGLPSTGSLKLNATPVSLNQVISLADLAAGNLNFTMATLGTDSFLFQVSNDGGSTFSADDTLNLNVVAAPPALVNVKFYNAVNGDPTYTGAGAIGGGSDQWNNFDFPSQTTATPYALIDSTGGGTSTTLTYNNGYDGGDNWGNGDYWTTNGDYGRYFVSSGTTPYYDLMRSYIHNVNMTVKGLTPGNYDFYVYLSSQRENLQHQVRIWANGGGGAVMQKLNHPNDVPDSALAPMVVHRDYVKFKNIAVNSAGELNFYWDNGEETLCGFQLASAVANNLPTAANNTFSLAMNAYRNFSAADFGFADSDAGDELQTLKVTSLPAAGSLTLSGNPVLLNQVIAAGSLSGLRFTPAASATGAPYTSFQFKVSDGVAYSAAADTITFNVYPAISGANLVNVKFYHAANGDPTYPTGPGAIGGASDQWNNLDATSDNIYAHRLNTLLTDTAGNPTGVGLMFNQANWDWDNWGNGDYWTTNGDYGRYFVSSGTTPYYDLMRSYIHNVNMTVYGLTPGNYDFYVYLSSQRENLQHQVRIWANGGGGAVMQKLNHPNDVPDSSLAPMVVHRDYVKFKNVMVDANGQLNFWWDNGEQTLCGFQLASAAANTLPTGANKTFTMALNAYQNIGAADFGFADSDAGDELQAVKVTSLPAAGSLTLSGNPVLLNQEIAASALTGLRFTPAANATGAPYTSFQVKVSDGTAFSASAQTLTFNVYPAISGANLVNVKFYHAANGDPTYPTGPGAIGSASDQWNNLDATSDNVYAHRLNTLLTDTAGNPTGVGLMFNQANWDWDNWGNGDYWTTNGDYGRYYVSSGSTPYYDLMRSYIHNVNMTVYGLTPGNYDFYVYLSSQRENLQHQVRIWANGGGGAVMQKLNHPNDVPDSALAPMVVHRDYVKFKNVTVDANGQLNFYWDNGEQTLCGFQLASATANSLPTGANSTVAMAVNSSHTCTTSEFGFADADAGDELQSIKIITLPAQGDLFLTGWTGPVLQNQIIAASSIASGGLSYVPAANGTGTGYASFQFKVSDGTALSASANTMTFNVYPQPSLINVKFYHASNGDAPYSGAAAVGSAGDQWNNIDATSDGIFANRVNTPLGSSGGAPTGVRLLFNQANWDWDNWGSGNYTTTSGYNVTNADPTYDLMRSYIHNCNMSLTGLTPGVYDFIVYSVANRNNVQHNTRFWINAGNGNVGPMATTANLPGAPLVENRDYVTFSGVVVSSTGNLNLWWDNGEELLCGFQLKSSAVAASPYDTWIAGYPTLTGGDTLPTADPDDDGLNNLGEFAFKGDPTQGGSRGLFFYELKDNSDGDVLPELTFTLAVRRSSVAFAADANTAQSSASAIDGVNYTIESDVDMLGVWDSPVTYIGKSNTPPSGSGLEDLTGDDWEYRTFSSFNGTPTSPPGHGFTRGRATAAP